MPLMYAHGKSIYYAHVPKAGGSSVEDYLVRRFGDTMSLRVVRHWDHKPRRGLIIPTQHLAAADLVNVLPRKVDHHFAVVRDPVNRVKSQFRFQSGSSQTQNFKFSTWLRIMFACANFDPRAYLNHIRPQSDLILQEAEIFKLEDKFSDMIAWLDSVTGTSDPDVTVGHLLNRKHDPITMYREDVALISQFYEKDYSRFGYVLPDLDEFPSDKFASLRTMFAKTLAPAIMYRQRRRWLR